MPKASPDKRFSTLRIPNSETQPIYRMLQIKSLERYGKSCPLDMIVDTFFPDGVNGVSSRATPAQTSVKPKPVRKRRSKLKPLNVSEE